MSLPAVLTFLVILSISSCASRESRFGSMTHQRAGATAGSFIVAPIETEVALVSTNGSVLKTWKFDQRAVNAALLRNGELGAIVVSLKDDKVLRPFGRFEIRDDQGQLRWVYENPGLHHDFEELDHGEFLFLTYSSRTIKIKNQKARCDRIIQVNRNKDIVWELDLTDFIPWKEITTEWDENILTKDGDLDLCHANSVRYKDGEILVSLRNISRVMVLSKKEKKLLWMSPKGAFRRQHDAQWIPGGKILVFNNEEDYSQLQLDKLRPSSVMSIDPTTNKTETLAVGSGFPFHWSSSLMGGAQLLSNGHLWVSVSMNGQMIEVDQENRILQRYVVHPVAIENSNTAFFRSRFYEDHPVPGEKEKSVPGECPQSYVSWDSCRSSIGRGKEGQSEYKTISLPPKACDGWEGEAMFHCEKGKWELIKKIRCQWTCPCCY